MIFFFALALIWLIVTLIGHLSWVAVAAVVRAVFRSPSPPANVLSRTDDAAAAQRVISRMASALLLSPAEAKKLRQKIDQLDQPAWHAPPQPSETIHQTALPSPIPSKPVPSKPVHQETLAEFLAPRPQTPVATSQVREPAPTATRLPPPVAGPMPEPERQVDSVSDSPRAKVGKSLAEFLAEHNIRWGELIAGLLIVVCSIGLVFSLWTTITQMHRVIPSLIFLAGNTAIFGAGFYTLFRWRLQDTSRATLVIATLLVPLGILAGLSTAGIDTSSVVLNDPITVLSILVAGAIYVALIWQSSRALVGSSAALSMTIGVAGPAAVLPLVPASIRVWGASAGSIACAGSIAVAGAITWMMLRRREVSGNAIGRRALIIGVTSFSLAVMAAYIGFMLRATETGWRAIAMSTLPGVVMLAAAAESLAGQRRHPKLALAGSVYASCALFVAGAMIIPMMVTAGWLWTWAVSFSIAAATASIVFRSSRWTVVATIPVSIAFLLHSPTWAGGIAWAELPMWKRLIGGEPMLAALFIAATVGGIALLMRKISQSKGLLFTAAGWLAYATVNAALLTVAPASAMGSVPSWVLSLLLGSAGVAIVVDPWRRSGHINANLHAGIGTAVVFSFWLSVFKPLVVGQPFAGLSPALVTLLATAFCGVVAGEVLFRQKSVAMVFRSFACMFLVGSAAIAVMLVFAPAGAAALHTADHQRAIAALSACVFGWLWIGLTDRDRLNLYFARVFLVITAVLVGHCYFNDALMTTAAWQSGLALWSWAALGWAVVAAIAARDRFLRALRSVPDPSRLSFLAGRFSWYQSMDHQWDLTSHRTLAQLSMIATVLASIMGFGSLVLTVGHAIDSTIYREPWLPAFVLAAGGVIVLYLCRVDDTEAAGWSTLRQFLVASVFVWVGWQVAIGVLVDPSEQLVLATSIATVGCFLTDLVRREPNAAGWSFTGNGILTSIGLTCVALSSTSLLMGAWIPAVRQGISPDQFETLSVAAWWSAGAVTSGWLGQRHRSNVLAVMTALLVPGVVTLLMPLWIPGQWWVWVQSAAIASGIFAAILGWVSFHQKSEPSRPILPYANNLSLVACSAVGLASCLGLIWGILRHDVVWMQLQNPAGLILAAMMAATLVLWNRIASPAIRFRHPVIWPITLSVTSGNLAMAMADAASSWSSASAISPHQLLPAVWSVVAVVSIAESCRIAFSRAESARLGRWHAGVLVVAASVLCLVGGSSPWYFRVGLIACVAGGILVTAKAVLATWGIAKGMSISKGSVVVTRTLCWYVMVIGLVFIARINAAGSGSEELLWSLLIAWVGTWGLLWRLACPDRVGAQSNESMGRGLLADGEAAALVLTALFVEAIALMVSPESLVHVNPFADSLLWLRMAVGLAVSLSVSQRHHRRWTCEVAVTTVLVVVTMLGVRIGLERLADSPMLVTIVCLVVSSTFAVMVFAGGSICRVMNFASDKWPGLVAPGPSSPVFSLTRFGNVMTHVAAVPSAVLCAATLWLLFQHNSDRVVPVAICGVALLAASLAELAERTGRGWLRHCAVAVALASIAMWASVNVDASPTPGLSLTTRWFVGWVILSGALAFGVPKLISASMYERWKSAIRSGFVLAISLAVGSLIATLVQEGMIRVAGQTEQLVKPLYLGMAVTLALLSLLATLGAIFSGPGFSYRAAWQLSDRGRVGLVVAAQTFGGLTWFHLFLCKSPLASLGLRAYWPYVVMTLAFVSVGITEWARRRDDKVLAKTLKQTALFLPLVPVIGFWLSGSWVTSLFGESEGGGWTYIQGRVSYQAVLVAAALYYGVISFLWKSGRARLVSIAIGNLALWVILIQTPNWDFLTHPQAWLIPPAVCVLVATHLHRESLGSQVAAGIRYAATLTIYITSTADMLIQGVGSTMIGPMILIVLALAGAAAGVALRVRPFLYLGVTFVFIGVTSMVWHAQQQIDAVWPWWVFGITTGVLLMIALMAIEKNKPRLKRIAMSLQQWEA